MFNAIRRLLLLKKKSKESDSDAVMENLKRKMEISMDKFMNRPIYKILTVAIIDNTTDEELVQTIFDNLCEKLPEDYHQIYQAVMSWTKPQQVIYISWCVEAEVNNGGFNQFYFNSSGEFAHLAPAALELMGAEKLAMITEKANAVYEKEYDYITRFHDGTLEGFSKSYENNPLSPLDGEFYEVSETENLHARQVAFIRKNKDEFIA